MINKITNHKYTKNINKSIIFFDESVIFFDERFLVISDGLYHKSASLVFLQKG